MTWAAGVLSFPFVPLTCWFSAYRVEWTLRGGGGKVGKEGCEHGRREVERKGREQQRKSKVIYGACPCSPLRACVAEYSVSPWPRAQLETFFL